MPFFLHSRDGDSAVRCIHIRIMKVPFHYHYNTNQIREMWSKNFIGNQLTRWKMETQVLKTAIFVFQFMKRGFLIKTGGTEGEM